MRHFYWARCIMLLAITLTCHVLSAQLNYTYESNAPFPTIATHQQWENSNVSLVNGSEILWGTTLRDPAAGLEEVYLQFADPSSGVIWDHRYASNAFHPNLQFHGMVHDGNQIVVAASSELNPAYSSFPYIMGIDLWSGNVNWTVPLVFGDNHEIRDMQIIEDMTGSGDFVIAMSIQAYNGSAPVPYDWSGLAALKVDQNGNLIWLETYREPGLIANHFRLTDLIQSTISGNYVLAGAYSGNGGNLEEAFLMEIDFGSGLMTGGMNLYNFVPGPEEHISVTDNGNDYLMTFYSQNQTIGICTIDPSFNPNFAEEVNPLGGKSLYYADQIRYEPFFGAIELMVTMQDNAGRFSTAFGKTSTGSPTIAFEEIDFAPGFKEAYPVGMYHDLVAGTFDFLFLSHPQQTPGPTQEYVRVHDYGGCLPINSYNGNFFSHPVGFSQAGLVSFNQFNPYSDQPNIDNYDGRIYDCGWAPFSSYRKAEPGQPVVSLYPNPTPNRLELSGDLSKFTRIEVLDQMGRVVLAQPIDQRISVQSLAAGVYHLVLLGKDEREVLKFTKQ